MSNKYYPNILRYLGYVPTEEYDAIELLEEISDWMFAGEPMEEILDEAEEVLAR